jgi:hypothetical protein
VGLGIILEQNKVDHPWKTMGDAKKSGWSIKKPNNLTDTYPNGDFMWSYISIDGNFMYKKNPEQNEPEEGSTPPPPPNEPGQDRVTSSTPVPASNPYEKWGRVFKFTTEDDKEVRIAFDNDLISSIEKFKSAGYDDDDSFVRAVTETYPKIRFIHFLKGTANLKESVEIKGLSALIVEQEYQTWTVMRAPDGINFKLRQGKIIQQPSSLPGKPATPPQQTPEQKPAEPAKPEGEELLKKEQQAVEKASVDEKEGDKMFTTIQQRYINQYNQELWTTEKPLENLLSFTENINLEEKHPEVFNEPLIMYRAKTNTPDGIKDWAEKVGETAITDQKVTRGGCRTNIKVYYDMMEKNIAIGEEKLENLAQIVMKCQDQIDNFNDFGLTKKRLQALSNLRGERKRFQLNFGTNTRG